MHRIDFHIHSIFSDGELLPSELVRRAEKLGHSAVAITDHVDISNIDWITPRIAKVADELNRNMNIRMIPGVEITHVPTRTIAKLAKFAKKLGAELVVVHGETIVEPVHEGTNEAALACEDVDILAHPGLITPEQAERARETGIYLELSSRKGHCLTNGWVVRMARESKAKMLVNTDAHSPTDLITLERALEVARGAGLNKEEAEEVVVKNSEELFKKVSK